MFIKKHWWEFLYTAALTAFTIYIALDTFVISHVYSVVSEDEIASEAEGAETVQAESSSSEQPQTDTGSHRSGRGKHSRTRSDNSSQNETADNDTSESTEENSSSLSSYSDENIQITITEYRENGTTIYAADIVLSSPEYLKTALAQSSYGKNITEKTSEISEEAKAILAINGDYYGAREKGHVIRNGVLYRDTPASGQEDLVIYNDGSFEIISEDEITAEELISAGAEQVLSFGPALVTDGETAVTEDEEVGKAKVSNPRTAVGIIDDLHYVFVVSDGRTEESAGLSLSQLAEFMKSLGVKTAYNLDGGGSSTMYFNGSVINNPTTNGKTIKERSVSDIVYIGY
ncbi:MAG: phosphodiester glycosidase family protein [Clostridiales bacterium]|nr:phosphodiester glycosidase family protein [Clostridiales bacterium]